MWEISTYSQLTGFLYSLLMGSAYAVIYDILKAAYKYKRATVFKLFIRDIFFFILTAFCSFCFFIATTNGEIRAYILVGTVIGFVVYYNTVSRIMFPILVKGVQILKNILARINMYLSVISERFDLIITKILNKWIIFFKKP